MPKCARRWRETQIPFAAQPQLSALASLSPLLPLKRNRVFARHPTSGMQRFNLLQRACETWVAAFASAPLVLTYPLFMVIFGRNAWTIIMMGFLSALPPVILKTIEGISGTRKVLVNVGRSFNLTATQQFWKILFPAALPTIFVGIRLGLIFALINVVGTEFLINFGGLGQLINDLAERYDLAGTYAAICFVILVSVLFFMALEKAERWLRPVN